MIHHVFANRSNIGDWLSARGLQTLLGHPPVIEHCCDEPFVPATIAALRAARRQDVILIGGGGLLAKYFEPFWEGFAAIADDVPFAICGVGCCDFGSEAAQVSWSRLAAIVRKSRLCTVRDELTRTYLRDCALPPPVPCPSMSVVRRRRRGWGVLHVDSSAVVGSEVFDYMNEVALRFAADTGRPFRRTNNTIQAGDENRLAMTLDLYRRSDLIVSSRLHGCVIALAMGRPVVAVAADRKVEAFMRAAGLSEWVLDVSTLGSLSERLLDAHAQPSPRAFLERARAENRSTAVQLSAHIRGTAAAVA